MTNEAQAGSGVVFHADANKSQERLLSLQEWISLRYSEKSAPCIHTVRRWVREGRVQPAPEKQGRSYFFRPDAKYVQPQ